MRIKKVKAEPVSALLYQQAIDSHKRTLAHLITTSFLQARALSETLTAIDLHRDKLSGDEMRSVMHCHRLAQDMLLQLDPIVSDQGNALGREEVLRKQGSIR